jgi:hypothetical protein
VESEYWIPLPVSYLKRLLVDSLSTIRKPAKQPSTSITTNSPSGK